MAFLISIYRENATTREKGLNPRSQLVKPFIAHHVRISDDAVLLIHGSAAGMLANLHQNTYFPNA
jgi:hypothetical protein